MAADRATQQEAHHEGRGAHGDGHRQEGGVHGADVRGAAGKQVVRVEVQQGDDGEGRLPLQPQPADHAHHLRGIGLSAHL
jgi:hypothetical protein